MSSFEKLGLESKLGVVEVDKIAFDLVLMFPIIKHVLKFGWCYRYGHVEGVDNRVVLMSQDLGGPG